MQWHELIPSRRIQLAVTWEKHDFQKALEKKLLK